MSLKAQGQLSVHGSHDGCGEGSEESIDLDQIRANLACTPAERLALLRQMDDFFLMARRARWIGPAVPVDGTDRS